MGNTFAHLSWLGKIPESMLLFMSNALLCDKIQAADLIIISGQVHVVQWLLMGLMQRCMTRPDRL